MIKAPYNFVPLSEKVFFPPWAEQVSHDIPFSDGESGEIEIKITAKSPIFIRNHEVNGDKFYESNGKKISTEFCNHNGQYYIPGSSVKGMVRNVLEIMSFGKISIDEKYENKYPVRDMTNRSSLVGQAKGYGILTLEKNGEFSFQDYGDKIYLMLQDDIERQYPSYENVRDSEISKKYNAIDPFSVIKVGDKRSVQRGGFVKHTVGAGDITGKLFFGNHINGKHYEFVLLDPVANSNLTLDGSVVENFKQIYFYNKYDKGNEIGHYWRMKDYDEDNKKEIPVFYKKNNNQITDLGLSQLFKLAYKYTISDASSQDIEYIDLENETKEEKLDLAETIFGASRKMLSSVKGRVQFSHFVTKSNPGCNEVTTILGSPRPSYYPIYIKQNCINGNNGGSYNTLMDANKISGWKRYPLHKNRPNQINSIRENRSSTTFCPLGTYKGDGSFNEFVFMGKLRYHNLKKVELGALISAITFHANQDDFFHNIGLAKPYGYGKIVIDIENFDTDKDIDALIEYENLMNNFTDNNWLQKDQIKELFTMADSDSNIDDKLKYLTLAPDQTPSIDEFKTNKENNQCLEKASSTNDISQMPQSITNRVEAIKCRYQKKKILHEKKELLKRRDAAFTNNQPTNRQLNKAIKEFVTTNVTFNLPAYYDLNQFGQYITDNYDNLEDNVINVYDSLCEMELFTEELRELLYKKFTLPLTNIDKVTLYRILRGENEVNDYGLQEFIDKWSENINNYNCQEIIEIINEVSQNA